MRATIFRKGLKCISMGMMVGALLGQPNFVWAARPASPCFAQEDIDYFKDFFEKKRDLYWQQYANIVDVEDNTGIAKIFWEDDAKEIALTALDNSLRFITGRFMDHADNKNLAALDFGLDIALCAIPGGIGRGVSRHGIKLAARRFSSTTAKKSLSSKTMQDAIESGRRRAAEEMSRINHSVDARTSALRSSVDSEVYTRSLMIQNKLDAQIGGSSFRSEAELRSLYIFSSAYPDVPEIMLMILVGGGLATAIIYPLVTDFIRKMEEKRLVKIYNNNDNVNFVRNTLGLDVMGKFNDLIGIYNNNGDGDHLLEELYGLKEVLPALPTCSVERYKVVNHHPTLFLVDIHNAYKKSSRLLSEDLQQRLRETTSSKKRNQIKKLNYLAQTQLAADFLAIVNAVPVCQASEQNEQDDATPSENPENESFIEWDHQRIIEEQA